VKHFYRYTFIVFLTILTVSQGRNQTSDEFYQRRMRLISAMDSSSAAVLKAAEGKTRSNDVTYRYRQESNFLYLTGIKESGVYFLLIKNGIDIGGKRYNTIYFVPGSFEDLIPSFENEITLSTDRFKEIFNSALLSLSTLYVSSPDLGFVNDWLNNKRYYMDKDARKELREQYPNIEIKKVSGIVSELREIKSKDEIKFLQKTIDITGTGLSRAITKCKPDMFEYELQAEIEYQYLRQGSEYPGFPSIVGSGPNSHILHYDKNIRKMKSGELVVMDVGAEINGYSADITRTIPVSGKFAAAQRKIYQLLLYIQNEVFKIIKPGLPFKDIDNKFKELVSQKGYSKYIRHGITHHLGLDVHDVWFSDTLKQGMVITVEPGLYIPQDDKEIDEEYRGIAIRIEDDVLVNENGCTILSKNIPKELDEIESMIGR
jgi:Xaa-Pro aminopeptidase